MDLWGAVQCALGARDAAALLDGDGTEYSGPQLLRLVKHVARLIATQLADSAAAAAAPVDTPCICAIYLTNSPAYVAAVLAALRLGLAFMPLDPDWPPQRLQQLCDEVQPAAVVWAPAACPGGHGAPGISGWPAVQLPPLPELAAAPAGDATRQQQPVKDNPSSECCYLLFTSGSTGRPLAVRGTQAGVLNRCRWLERACPFQAGDRVAFKTSPCFVDSIWELFGPLLAGVPLVAVPRLVGRDPARLLATLASRGATHLAAVPTLWRALAASLRQRGGAAPRLQLRLAVSSGEPLPPGLLAELQQLLPAGCCILNLYGSTEVAADCTAFDCTAWQPEEQQQQQQQPGEQRAARRVPAGQPISGTLVAVLAADGDEERSDTAAGAAAAAAVQRTVLPLGSVGEVAVAGAGLAAGYLCRHPDAAAAQQARFVQLPSQQVQQAQQAGASVAAAADVPAAWWQQDSMRLFLTGDLGWLDAGGCLHLLGRRDHQVKISGGRVDLAEVEAALCRYPAVAVAAAKLWQLPAGPILAAYVQLTEALPSGSSPTGSDLQDWCRQRLQPAAVPQHVALLPQLPLSASGKVQRSQLLQPQEVVDSRAASAGEPVGPPSKRLRASPAAAPAAAVTELQTSLVFAAALGHSDFEATSNLFALGGNSLMAAQIAGAVAGGDVEAVLQHPTVRALTAFLNSRAQAGATPAAAAGTIQQLAAPPAAVVAARRLSINGGGEQQQDQQQPGAMLQLAWRARMLQCVDAAPVLEAQPQAGCSPRIFACSHGGDVCCYDASSGQQLWQTQLPDCTDAGLALCRRPAGSGDKLAAGQQFVAAATNSGTLVFLDAASGAETGSVACGGGIRAPPACDPWCGLVWQPTHGRQLVVAAAPGAECLRLPLPAAVSAAVAFDAEQRLAYVSCLDGTLLAIAVEPASLAATAAAAAASGSRLQLAAAWQHEFGAPLFAPPLVLPGGRVVAAAVDGGVAGFGGRDGSQLWQASVGSAVFAPLLAADSQRVLLAGMQSGKLAAIACSSGQQLAAVELGAKVTGLQLLPSGAQDAQELLVATLAPGIVVLADATRLLSSAGSGSSVLDAVQLPSDVFAPPAVGSSDGGRPCVAVGCRDDHLYCLSVHAPVVD